LLRIGKMIKLKLFKNKKEAGIFLIFLMLSAFYWFLNALDNQYTTEERAEITIENIDSGLVVVNDIPEEILFKAKGSGFDLFALSLPFNSTVVKINLQDFEPKKQKNGTAVYNILKQELKELVKNQISSSVEIIDVLQDTITIIIDKQVTKKIPVQFSGEISSEENYIVEAVKLIPDSVEVTAPNSLLDTLKFIQTKKYLYEKLDEPVSETIDLINPNEQFCILNPEEITLEINVAEFVPFEMQVNISLPGNMQSVRLAQTTVTVKGLIPEDKKELLTEKEFKVIPDLTKSDNPDEIQLILKKCPDFAKKCKLIPEKVLYNFER